MLNNFFGNVILFLVIALCYFLSGCVKVKGKVDPIEVKSITVEHRITLDTEELYNYYLEICKEELPDGTEEELKSCADKRLNDFIEKFTNLM